MEFYINDFEYSPFIDADANYFIQRYEESINEAK